jgi:arylsulfatase A-like enzyme
MKGIRVKLSVLFFSVLFAVVALAATISPGAASERPNIVVILADDLGNADLGYRGSAIRTPALDQLARDGVRLESWYGQQLCTPARAALMTGRYPMRYGLQTGVIFPAHTYGLPTDETTLPQALQAAGYKTAMVGKWHLGHADRKYWPQNRGFDTFYGNLVGEVGYFDKQRGGVIDWQRNGEFFKDERYLTTLIGDEAVKIISSHDTAAPLFLYVASLAVHTPLEAPEANIAAYNGVFENAEKRTYAAMLTALDTQVGRIVEALKTRGMYENTIIFFSSDNGGVRNMKIGAPGGEKASEPPASNLPYRDGKATLYEGGVRVPSIISWPKEFTPRVVSEPLHHVDLMPTLLGIAGIASPPAHPFDGRDATATLRDGAPSPHDNILLNVEPYRGAVRKGDWKLVKLALLPGRTELFNLAEDPSETTNVAASHPQVVAELEALLLEYARQQSPSQWLRVQPAFLGPQGKTVFDEGYDIDDGGLLHEAPVLP